MTVIVDTANFWWCFLLDITNLPFSYSLVSIAQTNHKNIKQKAHTYIYKMYSSDIKYLKGERRFTYLSKFFSEIPQREDYQKKGVHSLRFCLLKCPYFDN